MEYHFKIHKGGKGYWAECIELKGCATQGKDRKVLERNMKEALNAYLDEPESSRVIYPLPKVHAPNNGVAAVPVNPQVAFAFLLRRERLQKKLTQKKVAERLRVGLYSYQRLESSRTANPRLSTIAKIRTVFPSLPIEKLVA